MVLKAFFVILVFLLIGCSFFGGVYYGRLTLGEVSKFILKEPLVIQRSPNNLGQIPAGVILYEYRHLPEISRYYMFIQTKEIDKLEPYREKDKYNFISGVDAYTE